MSKEIKMEEFDILSFVKERNPMRISMLGSTGSGKSTLAKHLLYGIQQYQKKKILVSDPKGDMDDFKILSMSDFNNNTFIRRLFNLNFEGKEIIDHAIIAEWLSILCVHFAPSTLYLDEVADCVGKKDELNKSHRWVYKVLQQGRSRKLNIIVGTQKVSQFNYAFSDESTDIFVFECWNRELRAIEKGLGLDNLSLNFNHDEDYSFFWVNKKKGITYCHKVPKTWKLVIKKK